MTILYAVIGIPIMLLCLANIGDFMAHSFKYLYAQFLRQYNRLRNKYKRRKILKRNRKGGVSRVEISDLKIEVTCNAEVSTPLTQDPINNSGGTNNHMELETIKGNGTTSLSRQSSARVGDEVTAIDTNRVTVPVSVCLSLLIGYISLGAFIFSVWEKWKLLDGAYFCFVTLSTIGFGDFVPGASLLSKGLQAQTKLATCALYLLVGLALISMCFNLVQEEVARKFYSLGKRIGLIVEKHRNGDLSNFDPESENSQEAGYRKMEVCCPPEEPVPLAQLA